MSDGYGGRGENPGEQEKKSKTCIQNLIIIPSESAWLGSWKFLVHLGIFFGYFNDPFYIAFVISRSEEEISNMETDMTQELIIDIMMALQILISCLTSY